MYEVKRGLMIGPVADRSKGHFNRIGRLDALPVLGREIKGVYQVLAVLHQFPCGFWILGFITGQELVRGRIGIVTGLRHPDS